MWAWFLLAPVISARLVLLSYSGIRVQICDRVMYLYLSIYIIMQRGKHALNPTAALSPMQTCVKCLFNFSWKLCYKNWNAYMYYQNFWYNLIVCTLHYGKHMFMVNVRFENCNNHNNSVRSASKYLTRNWMQNYHRVLSGEGPRHWDLSFAWTINKHCWCMCSSYWTKGGCSTSIEAARLVNIVMDLAKVCLQFARM